MDMVIAMIVGMVLGMLVHVVLGLAAGPLIGMFEAMIPASLIGMYGGMFFGMRDSMAAGSRTLQAALVVGAILGAILVAGFHFYESNAQGPCRRYRRVIQPGRFRWILRRSVNGMRPAATSTYLAMATIGGLDHISGDCSKKCMGRP